MSQRVVFLITDLELGGTPLLLRRIVRGLKDLGRWEPTVVSIKPAGIVGHWIRHEGVEVIGLNARSGHDIAALRRWIKTLNQLKPTVVVSMLVHANILATAAAAFSPPTTYVQSIQTLQPEPRWHWRVQGILSGQCAGIITPSRAVLERVSQFGRVNHAYVIPCGIDYETFAGAEPIPSDQRPWPTDARAIGYIGRFDKVKRLDFLITEFAQLLLKDYHQWSKLYLALIGYGPEEKRLRALAAKLGIASHLVFPGATAEPARWYKAIEVMCMPSVVEGYGMNIIESMACGTPVAACRSPATEEIITHLETGFLATQSLQGSLADAIATLLRNKPLAKKISDQAQSLVRTSYSAMQMVAAYQNVLEQVSAIHER